MRPYWSPYVVGVGLGLVVLATYGLMGHGPGASGAFTHVAAGVEGALAPGHARANPYLAGYLEAGRPWAQWIVVQVIGVALGGLLGSWSAGTFAWRLDKGQRLGRPARLLLAFVGGAVVGVGSRIAQGCTSGLALSGGAVLAVGAWAFLAAFMVGGFVAAQVVRRAWR